MNHLTRRLVLLGAAGALVLGTIGCGDSAGPFDTAAGQPTTTGQATTTSTTGAATETTGQTDTTGTGGQYLPIGGTPIEQLTPEQGAGAYPFFEWAAVPEAAFSLLFVFDTNGVTYWAWEGTATSVYLGGLDQPPTPGSMGPVLDAPMTWAVIAFDATDNLIASSAARPIAP
jgi:hypothetical protein